MLANPVESSDCQCAEESLKDTGEKEETPMVSQSEFVALVAVTVAQGITLCSLEELEQLTR